MIRRLICMLALIVTHAEIGISQITPQNKPFVFEYTLTPAKKMFYTSRSRLDYSGGTLQTTESLEIWVLKRNNDRSWQLLLHNSEASIDVDSKGMQEELSAESSWGFCDFYPNGRFNRNWTMDNLSRFDLYLPNIFVPLPGDFSQTSLLWDFTDRVYGESDRYSANKPDPEERSWIVHVDYESPLDPIYLLNQQAEVYIDLLKGIPVYKKGTYKRGHGFYAGKGTTTTILDSIVDVDIVLASRFARDLRLLLAADSQYDEIIYQIEANPAQLVPLRQDAENVFSQLKTRITTNEIRTQLNERITSLPGDFDRLTEHITKRARIVNKRAPNWQAEDFSGQRHSSEEMVGRIVLLDFWYRACPWCIRSMPLIDKVAQHFKGKPVTVLGVNTDKERSDAIFVIQRMNPTYTNISGRDLIKKYEVVSYPTFVIIDQKGFVRKVLIGYESNLAEKIIEIIEDLL